MRRFVDDLCSPAFLRAHPAVQAFAHYGLMAIHPFQDGTSRMARLLASIDTMRACSVRRSSCRATASGMSRPCAEPIGAITRRSRTFWFASAVLPSLDGLSPMASRRRAG
jgi:hypothetical protein